MKKQLYIISLFFLIFFLIGCDTFIVSPLIPSITATFHTNVGNGGYMVSFYSIFYVIFTFLLGPLSDRVERKWMIIIGMVVFSISSLVTGMAKSFTLILIARGATGVGAAFAAPNIWAFIGDYFDQSIRGKVTAVIASALSLGLVIGVPIGTLIEQNLKWQECFYVLAIFSFATAVLSFFFLPNINNSKKVTAINRKEYRDILTQSQVVYSYITTFLINFANFGLYTFLGYWLKQQVRPATISISVIFILAGIGNLAGVFLSGALSGKIFPRNVAAFMSFLLAVAFLTLPFFKSHTIISTIVIVIWMLAGGATFSAMQFFVTQISKTARGTVLAINNGFMWMGTAVGSAIVSIIIDKWSFPAAAYICSGLAVIVSMILKLKLKENIE